jgi:transcriptional regulator with XRE-family HTH domain
MNLCYINTVMNTVSLKSKSARIGEVLRRFREKKGLLLSEVSSRAAISVSMLSQIERGGVSPSIDTLFSVCGALELEISEVFRHVSSYTPVRVHRGGARLRTESRGVLYEQLVTSLDSSFPAEMFLISVRPGKKAGLSGQGHEGIEMGYILSGTATLTVDGAEYRLRRGDSVSYSAHHSHVLANTGATVFNAVWSVQPPHKDYLELKEKEQDK